jgi:hypothetical protein
VIIYFLAYIALEACLAKAIWIDLVGGSPPASGGNGCPSRGYGGPGQKSWDYSAFGQNTALWPTSYVRAFFR